MDLLEYADQATRLYPVQRFVLKVMAGVPLTDTNKDIRVTDKFAEQTLYRFTEAEYLKYLHDQGRASKATVETPAFNTVLACGRRSGKTTLHSLVAAHAVHRLMSMDDPQRRYGMLPNSRIRVASVSYCKDGAIRMHEEASRFIQQDEMSKRLIEPYGTSSKLRLRAGEGYVEAVFKSSVAKGLRGSNIFHAGIDEMAYFEDGGRDVYQAISPALAQFHPVQKEGSNIAPLESSMFVTSTPRGRSGFFSEVYRHSFHPEYLGSGVSLQIPTWEMNPTLHGGFLRYQYNTDPTFMSEYGAEFSETAYGVDIEDA